MGKFDGVLLVSDFDDTLIGHSLRLSDENRAAIEYFMKNGGRFTVATGRSHLTFTPQVPMVPMNAPVVLSNGAVLFDFRTDQLIYESTLPKRALEDLYAIMGAFPTIGFELYHGEEMYAFQPNRITYNHAKKVGIPFVQIKDPKEAPRPWVKAIFQQEAGLLLEVQQWIRARFPAHYEIIFSNHHLLELTAKGSTKGEQVRRLARLEGIDLRHLYCVGDNLNDLPMLRLANVGFCPNDAAPEVLEKDWVHKVGSSDDHCVRDVILFLEERYKGDPSLL